VEAWKALKNDSVKYLLYGGAAGGGKSYFIRWAAILWGFYLYERYKIKGVPIGLFCEDYPTLKDRQITRIKKEVPPEIGRLVESRDEGYIFESINREFTILLRNLDDPAKYASVEFAAIFVDELTKNPIETFEDLRFRLRYPGVPIPKFVAGTNPGSVGHSWVKKLWISPDPNNPDPEQEKFFFVPSNVSDNQYIDSSYVTQLKSLPTQKRKAYLDGSWDIFEGQVFDEFSVNTHVVRPFAIPSEWRKYIAMDWGSNKPFSIGWYAIDPDGRTYLYRELYMNSMGFESRFGKPLTARRLARIVLAMTRKAGESYEYMVADPSMWNKILLGEKTKDREGESYAEIMTNAGLSMVQGDNDRMNGMARYREALSLAPDGKPWYQIFSTCYDTIRTIPALVYDKHKVEDVDSDGEDHCYDRDRYLFMSRPAITYLPIETQLTPIQRSKIKAIRQFREAEDDDEYYEEG
jgi:hypothetical protein